MYRFRRSYGPLHGLRRCGSDDGDRRQSDREPSGRRDILQATEPDGEAEEGRSGGVATFLPAGHSFVLNECQVLVPGYAILTTSRAPNGECNRIVNVYLRPGLQRQIWEELNAKMPAAAAADPNLVVLGDFNIELSPSEQLPSPLLESIGEQWATVYPATTTWQARSKASTLDGALVRPATFPDWSATARRTTLSGHAVITFRKGRQKTHNNHACSPGKYWQLPEKLEWRFARHGDV